MNSYNMAPSASDFIAIGLAVMVVMILAAFAAWVISR
jgi:hypothetical protein